MVPIKSTKTALAITLAVVVLATLFGSHRSLNALREKALVVFEQGQYGDGLGVQSDLEKQHSVCANVNTVAGRSLSADDDACRALLGFFDQRGTSQDPALVQAEREAARQVLDKLDGLDTLTDKDRGYVSDLRSELLSVELTISRDPYNLMAEEFNDKTLSAFPANILHTITGVKPLAVYR